MLTLEATSWDYSADLNSPPARWSCTFLESGSSRFLPGEVASKQGKDRVAVEVVVNGSKERLLEGVVREWGVREVEDQVVATASGIDLKGILLDFFPSGPVVYRGMELLSAATAPVPAGAIKTLRLTSDSVGADVVAAFSETFQSVAADVCKRAGFRSSFDCRDYDLGQDIAWDTERTANDMLAQLAAPFNATERFKLDLFLESDAVRFVERGRSAQSTVEIAYSSVLSRTVRRSEFPPFNDVQVRGATYRFPEPDTSETTIVMGLPNDAAYSMSYRFVEKEANAGQDMGSVLSAELQEIVVAETNGTRYFNSKGEKFREAASKRYSFYVLRNPNTGAFVSLEPKIRREDTEETWEYNGPHGETTLHIKTQFVEDSTVYKEIDNAGVLTTFGAVNVAQYVERVETRTEYDSAGDPLYEIAKEYAAQEPKLQPAGQPAAGPTGLTLKREVEQFWSWSKGQRERTTVTKLYSPNVPGRPVSISSHTEVATGKGSPADTTFWRQTPNGIVGIWEAGAITSFPPSPIQSIAVRGTSRLSTDQVVAGPDSAQLRFQFPLLANKDDCEYFRGKIRQERKAARYEQELEFIPDLNVRDGLNLKVLTAPARWERDTVFVTGRRARHTWNEMTFAALGLAWIDP